MITKTAAAAVTALLLTSSLPAIAQEPTGVPKLPPRPAQGEMSFFITSEGLGDGANLGGLVGADAHCQSLAEASGAAGAAGKTWRAYLSTQKTSDGPAINARNGNILNTNTALTATGEKVPGEVKIVGQDGRRNQHDILTGTRIDGNAFTDTLDRTCRNWTTSSASGSANVGHHDRLTTFTSMSWLSAHASVGCSQDNLIATGGAGQFYCFAAD